MNKFIYSLLVIGLTGALLVTAGCKKPSEAPQTNIPKFQKKAEVVKPVLVQEEAKRPEYQIIGVRDPFQPFAGINPGEASTGPDALQRISISQVYLVGIIQSKKNRALIQDSSGMGFIITEGTLIGENNGIVTSISKDGVTIKQHFKDYMGRVTTREVVLALKKEEGVK